MEQHRRSLEKDAKYRQRITDVENSDVIASVEFTDTRLLREGRKKRYYDVHRIVPPLPTSDNTVPTIQLHEYTLAMTLRPKATPSSYSPAIANEQTAAVSTGLLVERDQKTCNGQSHLQRLARRKVRDVWWNGATNDLRNFFYLCSGYIPRGAPRSLDGRYKIQPFDVEQLPPSSLQGTS